MRMGEVGYDITAFSGSTLCQFILLVWGAGLSVVSLGAFLNICRFRQLSCKRNTNQLESNVRKDLKQYYYNYQHFT